MKRSIPVLLMLACLLGCTSRVITNTPRSAIEQMLLSSAVDLALEKFELPEIRGKKVCLDFTNLKAYDVEYIRVAIRARFARIGARLVDKPEDAEYIAEVASGALGIEFKNTLVGIPALPVPKVDLPSPEVPIYKRVEQTGILKLLIFVHADGRFVAANQYYAKVDREESYLLWWRFQYRDDLREGWERADLK